MSVLFAFVFNSVYISYLLFVFVSVCLSFGGSNLLLLDVCVFLPLRVYDSILVLSVCFHFVWVSC